MASFSSFKLTSKGLDLEYKAQMGKSLKFTKFELGDGELGLTPIKELTSLKHTVLSRNITKLEKNNSKVTIGFMLDNKELTEGFYWKEIGIFAEDPDTKEEILFMYSTAGETADYIPAFNSGNMLEKYIDVDILLSDVEEVQATIESSLVYVTNQDFEKNKEDFDGKLAEKVDKEALDIKYDTFSGALANIRNSSEAYMKSFYLEGVIEQETREGYNKFSLGKLKRSYGGTSTTGDDVIECEYNYSELKFDGILSYLPGQEFINKSIGVFKAGIYTFSSQLVSGTVTAKEGFDLDFEYGIKDSQGNNILTLSDFKNEKDVQNFTLNNDTELSFYLISNNSIVFDRTSIQLQITEGTEEKNINLMELCLAENFKQKFMV